MRLLAVYGACCKTSCFPWFADLENLRNLQNASKQKVLGPEGTSQALTTPEPQAQEASGRISGASHTKQQGWKALPGLPHPTELQQA